MRYLNSVKWFGLRKAYWTARRLVTESYERLIDAGFIFPSFRSPLLYRGFLRTLIRTYDGDHGHNIDERQYFPGYGLIHYSFVRNTKPHRVLCIGSRKGFIPALLALAVRENGRGHVDFVDAGYDESSPGKNWSGIGFWKKGDPAAHFSKIGVQEQITTYVMTTKQYAATFPDRRYQYVYVDGDHSYEGVRTDYSLFWPRLDPGGFMAFHDISARGSLDGGTFGVRKFWNSMPNAHAIRFPFPEDSGLGILQKP